MPITLSGGKQRRKFSLGRIEEVRRRTLESALPDVRTVLDAALGDPGRHVEMVSTVAPLVALVVAEIAVLDRQTDATDPAVVRRYGAMIETALGLHDEPWRAVTLWRDAATLPLEQFGIAWTAYLERAARDSEGRHQHRKLVDLEQISKALSLTRPRIVSIFGTEKCSLKPILLKDRTFTKDERREIRALSQRVNLSADWITHLALTLDPVTFSDQILLRELLILPDIDKYRMLGSSDVAVSRSVRRLYGNRKPGPRPKANTRGRQIEALARHRRVSTDTVKRILVDYRAWLETPNNPDPAVTLHQSPCHTAPEFHALRLANFDLLSNLKIAESITISGVTISDSDLVHIASIPWHKGPRSRASRKRYTYADKALVIAWWQATRNETPTPAQIRQWASRGHYNGYQASALEWQQEQQRRAQEDAEEQRLSRAA